MAKKGNRQIFALECSDCHSRGYNSEKNVITTKEKLTLKKYCRTCRHTTAHNEAKLK